MPLHTVLETLATHDGYGKIFFRADATGALAHTSSLIYLKPLAQETIPAFMRRLAAAVQPGDDIELVCERGALSLARITRPAAAATG
jgi:hypothetical protein